MTLALVALFLRILYTLLAALINSASYNPRTGGTTAAKIVLNVIPEFLLTLVLLVVGILSRNLANERINEEGDARDKRADIEQNGVFAQ